MSARRGTAIEHAEIVLPAPDLDATLAFFIDTLGFRVDTIQPADDPRVAVISAYGVRLRLDRDADAPSGVIRLTGSEAATLTAPNGTRIERVAADAPVSMPAIAPTFIVTRAASDSTWKSGRAGMQYRDLVPGRQGGALIASHIRIPDGGPVPDYVHYHEVCFQMIYCARGWVRVVYEDQGAPFVLGPGDCVIQPPHIRHRVLECSPGLEVIEISCPAEHVTHADHELDLPTAVYRPERTFGGQRFVHHEAAKATWQAWRIAGFEARDTGIRAASQGVAGACVARVSGTVPSARVQHDAALAFLFVLAGSCRLGCGVTDEVLGAGDACVIPGGTAHAIGDASPDLELLEAVLANRPFDP